MAETSENRWLVKYAAYVKVPFDPKQGSYDNEKYGNKEGWLTVEYQRVGTKAVKEKIPPKDLKAIDETLNLIMGRVNEGVEEMEVWFRENMKITMTTKQVEEKMARTKEQRALDVGNKLNEKMKKARDD